MAAAGKHVLGVSAIAALAVYAEAAHAHAANDTGSTWEWLLLALIVGAALLYGAGLARLWSVHRGAGVKPREALYYFLGVATLLFALAPPFDAIADRLFSVHMIQHELLMLVAAPLIALGQPLTPYLHMLPRPTRRPVARSLHAAWIRRGLAFLTRPLAAWWLQAVALWVWHAPLLFDAALHNTGIHIAQHASFLIAAVLYWRSLLPGHHAGGPAVAVLSLFGTAAHSNVLGALLTFAPAPFYAYDQGWLGLSALEDQQLGGLIMWVPAGTVYLGAALIASARLLRVAPDDSRYHAP